VDQVFRYWTLVKLGSDGRSNTETLVVAKHFLQAQLPELKNEVQDSKIQQHLWKIFQEKNHLSNCQLAQLCLRCFISHQIEQVCIQLENQFGKYYGFTRYDLFALVLDDGGAIRDQPLAFSERSATNGQQLTVNRYQPLAMKILERFDPGRASLATWTVRLVKQHHELNAFLLEQGLCMLSDWAILNDTKPKKLQRVLTQFHQLTQTEVTQAVYLLESYHAVYRRDRLLQRQKGTCPDPTSAQLQQISVLLQQQIGQSLPLNVILARLVDLATRLRQYRIAVSGGLPPNQSLDQPDDPLLDQLSQESIHAEDDNPQLEFLQTYRQLFANCLEDAVQRVVSHRLQTLNPPKQQNFLKALQLFHCDQITMGAIAPKIGLQAQYQVSRLLKLDELRADVRHWMLQCLRNSVENIALKYVEPDKLDKIDHQIAVALEERVDDLIQQEQANSKNPKGYIATSSLAQKLCQYLDQLIANNQQLTAKN